MVIKSDTFTVDAFNPVLQNAQDKGLAQAERKVHQGFIDLLTPVTSTAATFVYWYEGEKIEVDLAAKAKLGDLVTAINGDPENPGVTASIINDGLATTTSYHLVLTGKHTGAQHTIEIDSDTTLDNFDVVDGTGGSLFSTSQKATDAMLKVDGYPSDAAGFIHRSSNTVADIIDGLVLELHDAGTATVTVSNNISAVKEKVQMLVDSVNFVLDYVAKETKYDSETKESGVMIGNYTYDMVRNAINGILYESIPGLEGDTDLYTHLSQLGIQTNPDLGGKWVIDTTKLNDALNKDPAAVARLFVLDDERGSEGVLERLRVKMEGLTDSDTGIGNVLIENYNDIINGIDEKIAREERRIALVRERLEGKFSRLEVLLGQLDGQSKYIESQLDKLPTVGSQK
jgi:flagellar hook-associated protein 2